MPRHPLPSELGDAFSTSAASASGVSPERLRRADLETPFRAVRRRVDSFESFAADPHEAQRSAILRAAQLYALRMREDEFFSHTTAAIFHGVSLPALADEHPHVSVLAPARAARSTGIHGHEAQPRLTRVMTEPGSGLRIAGPATTWAMLASELRHPYDLIAAADSLVRVPRMPGGFDKPMPPPVTTIDQLQSAVSAGRRVGAPALRSALPRVRTGSSSRPETWTRLTLVDAGLPEPQLDHDVYDGAGRFVGCLDLGYPRLKVGTEYEGDHHRVDPATWNRDIDKHERLAELGWRVIRITKSLAYTRRRELVRRVQSARDRN